MRVFVDGASVANEEARRTLATAGAEWVARHHTCALRAAELLARFR